MDNAGLKLKPPGVRSLSLTLAQRARQLLPERIRISSAMEEERPRSGWRKAGVTYLFLVIAPVLVYFLYAALIESRGYITETRITVQSAPKKHVALSGASASAISRLIGGVVPDTEQDSYIVLNYVKSAAMVADLGGRPALERVFSKPGIDYFSRLPRGESIEDLLRYWRSRVRADVDTVSGLLTIKITAYSPEDALELTKSVNALSETLINNISLRVREDTLAKAKFEVTRAGSELGQQRAALLAFRNANELIDPIARAKSVGETIATLTLQKVDAETALSVLMHSNATAAPSVNVLKTKLATLDEQIDQLKAKLTAPASKNTVSSQIAGYEGLKLREEFASRVYIIAQDAYLRAQQELQRQQLYLITVVKPIRAEEATYPKVVPSTILLGICLSIFWSIGALVIASVRDQMD